MRFAEYAEPDHAPFLMRCHCGRCAYGNAGRAGGAVLVSGIVKLEKCILVDNEARLGPAVYNAVTVTLVSTDVCDNQLLCDDRSFLDWKHVSYKQCWRTSGGGIMLVRICRTGHAEYRPSQLERLQNIILASQAISVQVVRAIRACQDRDSYSTYRNYSMFHLVVVEICHSARKVSAGITLRTSPIVAVAL